MCGRMAPVLVLFLLVGVAPAWSQSIKTDGNIETEGQLVSKVADGTAPLAVDSRTKVASLNADLLDGKTSGSFALLSELLATIDSLDNPDPPCFDNSKRFVNCGNGTVTDTVTGIIWLENANCFSPMTYSAANDSASALTDGQCNLTDGSRPGDWYLPTWEDWNVMTVPYNTCGANPHLVGNGTNGGCHHEDPWALEVQSARYWSSTTIEDETGKAVRVDVEFGLGEPDLKTGEYIPWPVRAGH